MIVLEPIGALGFFARMGHAATYLSNICPDGSPVRMRLCRPGERGGMVSKYTSFGEGEHENYDWAIVPFEINLHGFESPELAPIIGTRTLQQAIERYSFERLFTGALQGMTNGDPPDGNWTATVANRFERSLYVFSVATTLAEDEAIVAAFNASRNTSRFNFFYGNCSDQAKAIFDLILPHTVGDRVGGITMETPKGLAKALVARSLDHPELQLRVRRFPQMPGTFDRSRDNLFPMENMYKSIAFTPYWYFGGFREVALVAAFYHQVISPFSVLGSTKAFVSPRAAQLTLEQRRLRARQDEVRRALASAINNGSPWSALAAMDARVTRRLSEIRREHDAEVRRVKGSKAEWRARDAEFQSMVRALGRRGAIPVDLRRQCAECPPKGPLFEELLRYFEARGTFSIGDEGRGAWLSLPFVDGRRYATGVSRAEILSGDPRVAVLVLGCRDRLQPPPVARSPGGHRQHRWTVHPLPAGQRRARASGRRSGSHVDGRRGMQGRRTTLSAPSARELRRPQRSVVVAGERGVPTELRRRAPVYASFRPVYWILVIPTWRRSSSTRSSTPGTGSSDTPASAGSFTVTPGGARWPSPARNSHGTSSTWRSTSVTSRRSCGTSITRFWLPSRTRPS